ncbi:MULTISPECIES: universal stress protein [Flavobacteriaceae]|jgi:nucleotide-binding universal stress UspA family protein|uniref:universal stress protein n=1 Tax=Flavobacteriaceae TaxID=49546 RepID=UPI000C0A6F9F|nr:MULTISPECIES: universal stress protein [Flavobacteriaceae]MAU16618.1 universal stress protein [Allomuricauda sp.]MAX71742.1 universal stress protein [Flavobacteriaceae bacterium]MDC7994130.1 universal stress protein [Altibacter sp. HG106]MDH7911967.1 universal stress protein [Winogradskyella sp. SYSU M77433]|tara:strand:- start:183 stop:644 length:462 start_codon:yes stop_codon:yes gene_type:complete
MKIVLAIDGSDFSKIAVKELNRITLPASTEICIINVYEFPTAIGPELMATGGSLNNYFEEFISGAKKLGDKIVSDASDTLKSMNKTLTITTNVVSGAPKNVILEKAEEWDADLIVVGSQGQGALSRLLLGSVSQYLATHAKCSVMIARDKSER